MFGALKLKLYHEPKATSGESIFRPLRFEGPTFQWQTCLRSVALIPDGATLKTSGVESESEVQRLSGEWLHSEEAYRRLLQIVCGLHSPLVGETEVFGQFKDAIESSLKNISSEDSALREAFQSTLRQWAQALIEDVKVVRQKHLIDLGSQSYGSLVRREVRALENPEVDFLGAGRLTAEILPWLLKSLESSAGGLLRVYARDVEKARSRLGDFDKNSAVSVLSLTAPSIVYRQNKSCRRVLVVAAPMSAAEIHSWVRNRGSRFDLVLDLRSESRADRLEPRSSQWARRLRSLDEMFSSIENARDLAEEKKVAALRQIDECVGARLSKATHRPFGWDDVWS